MKVYKGLVLQKITNHVDPKIGVVSEVVNEYKFYSVDPNQHEGYCKATVQVTSDRMVFIEQHGFMSTVDLINLTAAVRGQAQEIQDTVLKYMRQCAVVSNGSTSANNQK